jgi:glycosyltransferase involved in cell wall biosynthesis
MRVLFLSTYMKGGAANCAIQLGNAFRKCDSAIDISMLVRLGNENDWVSTLGSKNYLKSKFSFYFERLLFWPQERNKSVRFAFSPANVGVDITQHKLIKEADIIHMHWVNQGFLSIDTIEKLMQLGKPVVWSMHDMWPFTGGCHYAGTCTNYQFKCGNCNFLKAPSNQDLTSKILNYKKEQWQGHNVTYVGSSRWIANMAKSSSLLKNEKVIDLPTPVDTDLFKPIKSSSALRERLNISSETKVILFLAMSATDPRKGFQYLAGALKNLADESSKYEVLIVGNSTPEIISQIPFKTHAIGLLKSKGDIIEAYNSSDVFVIPSLEDNLPNTVMESLACGTPVVGFKTGGIPEMIDHLENGYIAEFKNDIDLANGVRHILSLSEEEKTIYSTSARNKALENYSMPVVTKKYKELYQSLV